MKSHIDKRSDMTKRVILDAASQLFARDSSAAMSALALAMGIGRATLHRHFPTRDALAAAMALDALDRVSTAIDACRPTEGPVADAMLRIAATVIPLADAVRILDAGASVWDLPGLNDRWYSVTTVIEDLVRRGQSEGGIRSELSPAWVADLFVGTAWTAAVAIHDGRLAANDAPGLVVDATLRGVGTP